MGFQDSGWIELRSINLLFGRNSTGKSAIMRALLLLKQSLTNPASGDSLTLVSQDGIDAGSFQQILHQRDDSEKGEPDRNAQQTIGFGFACRISPSLLESFQEEEKRKQAEKEKKPIVSEEDACATLRLDFGAELTGRKIILKGIEIRAPWLHTEGDLCDPGDGTLLFAAEWLQSEVITGRWSIPLSIIEQRWTPDKGNSWDFVQDFGQDKGFLPVLPYLGHQGVDEDEHWSDLDIARQKSDYEIVRDLLDEFHQAISTFLRDLYYLGPVRSNPQRFYYAPGAMSGGTNGRGMNALENWLRKWGTELWEEELKRVNTRLAELDLGLLLLVRPLDEERKPYQSIFEVLLQEKAGVQTSLCDTGFGWSQMLPIVLMCALAEEDSIVLIEQPELHLHPRAQTELADFFARTVNRGVRLLIETHSEHLLLRFRRRVARTTLNRMKRAQRILLVRDGENSPELALTVDQLRVYFVERKAGTSWVQTSLIDSRGQYVERPDGFRDFFSDDFEQVVLINDDITELSKLAHEHESNDRHRHFG